MTSDASATVYRDLAVSTAGLDRRKTSYRFDIDLDICWDRADQPGLAFGPTFLEALGIDLADLTAAAARDFHWAYALAVCESFHDLEDVVVRFGGQEEWALGPTRSMELLCKEELKHMQLFARFADLLRARRTDLAARWKTVERQGFAVPGSPEDPSSLGSRAADHLLFWLNTVFFEEFTIWLAECLEPDAGLVQPTWLEIHRCHRKEELQHIPTDVAHVHALNLSGEKRLSISRLFFFHLETRFPDLFGLRKARDFIAALHPDCPPIALTAFRDLPIFGEILRSRAFRRSRECAPYLAELAAAAGLPPDNQSGILSGPSLSNPRGRDLGSVLPTSDGGQLVYVADDGSEISETYGGLRARASRIAAGLSEQGVRPGDLVVLLVETPRDFLASFWACQFAGVVAVPVAPGDGPDAEEALERLHLRLGTPLALVADGGLASPALRARAFAIERLAEHVPLQEMHRPAPGSVAMLQFSSGSTGDPKGVVLTQANLIANITSTAGHLNVSAHDRMLNWLPLHHDMGLCMHLTASLAGIDQVLMTPRAVARRPGLWLDKLSRHRVTITASPNFGLALCMRRLVRRQPTSIDLSAVRCILNGAEPISARVASDFLDAMAPFGLSRDALSPCYGLAEATTAVTICRPGEGTRDRVFTRASLVAGGRVEPAGPEERDAVRLVDVGTPIPGLDVRVVDEDGRVLPWGSFGEIQAAGPNVSAGYWNDGVATARLRRGRWIRTGDMGFVQGGRLFIAGRKKDVVIAHGRKVHAEDLEEVVRLVPGLETDRVAVIGSFDVEAGFERVVVFLGHRPAGQASGEDVAEKVSAAVQAILGYPVHRVIILRPGDIPLTTSGKVRRHALRDRFERGDYGPTVPPAPAQAAPDAADSVAADDATIQAVREVWAEVLGIGAASITPDRNFADLGGDSLRAIEIHGGLEDRWGRLLDQRILLDCPTVRSQAALLGPPPGSVQPAASRSLVDLQPSPERGIAIIAVAGRFPGAETLDDFWRMLVEGRTVYGEVPTSRRAFRHDGRGGTDPASAATREIGSFLDRIADFDASACGLDEVEAREIDPQQRLFLEIVLDLIDQVHVETRRIGVFAGAAENEYFSHRTALGGEITKLAAQTNLANMLVARVAQHFRFTGPAVGLDAACATSLLSVHYACRSILSGECDLAVAGGVQINLTDVSFRMFERAGVLSPSGHCRPYGAEADGFVPGEGVGAVLLKPVSTALRDSDPILGIIAGSAVNNDGGAFSDMAPNPSGQAAVISAALAAAGIAPAEVSYIEGHGAGTPIGDLVEARALGQVFAENPRHSVALGSVKSNVGHLFHAAGLCGLIKVLLAFRHDVLPMTAGAERPNPRIPFDAGPLLPVAATTRWPRDAGRRRVAGISAFGVGGTNCHLVVTEPPIRPRSSASRDAHLICLSAPSAEDIARVGTSLAEALKRRPDVDLAAFCAALNPRAMRFPYRAAVVAEDRAMLQKALRHLRPGRKAEKPRLVFLFAGPDGRWAETARHLLDERVVSTEIAACDRHLRPWLRSTLVETLASGRTEALPIDQLQPVSVALGYALARWLDALGIEPDAVIGHSGGEYVAACLAGALSLRDALTLAAERGRAMALDHDGAMAAVNGSPATLRAVLSRHSLVDIACLNGPTQTVISGDAEAVGRAVEALAAAGLAVERLATGCAAHSRLMLEARRHFAPSLAGVAFHATRIPMISSVVARMISVPDEAYWLDHLTAPVDYDGAVRHAIEAGYSHFVDLGPSGTLSRLVREIAADVRATVETFTILRKGLPGWAGTLEGLGRLFENGAPLTTRVLDGHLRDPTYAPPAYPYQRKALWIEAPPAPTIATPVGGPAPSSRQPLELDLGTCPSIRDHRVHGEATAPTGLLLDLLLTAADPQGIGCDLEGLTIERPLSVPMEPRWCRVARQDDGSVRIESRRPATETDWTGHLKGRIVSGLAQAPARRRDVDAILARCPYDASPDRLTDRLARSGMAYGPTLRTVTRLNVGIREVLAHLEPEELGPGAAAAHLLDAGVMDGAMRAVGALLLPFEETPGVAFLCFSIGHASVRRPVSGRCLSHVRLAADFDITPTSPVIRYDLDVLAPDGELLVSLQDVCLRRHADPSGHVMAAADPELEQAARYYGVEWQERPVPDAAAGRLAYTDLVLIGPPSRLRGALEDAAGPAGLTALALQAPGDPARLDRLVSTACSRPSAGRIVVLESDDVEDIAALAGALGRQHPPDPLSLLIMTRSAAVVAFARSLGLEMPAWNVRAVEVRSGEPDASLLLAEAFASGWPIGVVYADGCRLGPALRTLGPLPTLGRKGGTYWMIGGQGAVGRAIAIELARTTGGRIVLSGRRPDPDEGLLSAMRACGAEAIYAPCDVVDAGAMERVHADIVRRFGPPTAVIHAAGDIADQLVSQRDAVRAQRSSRAKIEGARILAQTVRGDSACWIAFFSSLVALTGMPGQADYASANASMDALAVRLRAEGRRASSIAWGPWSLGMAGDPRYQAKYRALGLHPLSAEAGARAFMRLIGCDKPHVAIVGVEEGRERDLLARFGMETEMPRVDPAFRPGEPRPPESSLGDTLKRIVARQLRRRVEEVDVRTAFADLGLDSLAAVDIAIELQTETGLAVPPTLLLETETVADLLGRLRASSRGGPLR
jgi:acyl transferase domain-containing protein/acyl-CoA synthetase (AMP-forming)/AMP-acid ligase II/acyl carrier protein